MSVIEFSATKNDITVQFHTSTFAPVPRWFPKPLRLCPNLYTRE